MLNRKLKRRRNLILSLGLVLVLVAAACAPGDDILTVVPSTPTPIPTATSTATPISTPTSVPRPTPTPTSTPGPEAPCENATSATFEAGNNDNFTGTSEPTSPSADLQVVLSQYASGTRDFDELMSNRVFGHTFTALPTGIVAATLELHLRGRPDIPSNDALSLELVGGITPFGWARRISDLPEAGGTWNVDQDAVFTLDLAALPLAGGGFTDILPNVNLDQALDVYIQDDTAVDYMILTVLACPCTPPPPDLISWWPLDETSAPTAADIMGGNDGTHINGPTPIPGMVDGALSFDGKDDVVAVPTVSLQLAATGLTIDAWVRVDPEDLEGMFVDTRLPGLAGFMFLHKDGRLAFKLENLPGTTAPGPDLRDGQWHHVAVTVDVNTPPSGTLYVDGQNVHTFTLAAVSALNFTQDILIGNDPLNQLALQGTMDEVEIFNRALSAAEIQAIFQSGSAGKCKEVGEADLAIEKSHRGDFQVGQTGTYVINVTNNGPGDASGVTLPDPLPPGFVYVSAAAPWSCGGTPLTCTIAGSWPPGSLPPLILTVEVTDEAEPEVRNCATVTHDGIDPIEDNNTDCDSAVVTKPTRPDLAIEKSHALDAAGNPIEFHYGGTGSYQIIVTNVGTGPADPPITFFDDLPPGFTFDSYSGTDWTCVLVVSTQPQQVECTYTGPPVPAGDSFPPITINVKIDPIATFPGGSDAVENCATVVHPDDTNPTNDRSCVQTIITPAPLPDLTVTITAFTLGICDSSGCTVFVDFQVENIGDAFAGPFDILIEEDTGGFSPLTIQVPGGLSAGSVASFSETLGPGSIAAMPPTVMVTVDSGFAITESDETNNSDSQTL